ncbi:GtrA family protein [bacterium]|nr:MAG: GtrA family protein [bacterium]
MERRIKIKQYLFYMFFAGVAICINLLTQMLVKKSLVNFAGEVKYHGYDLIYWIQLVSGTITGFVFKFIVDKFYIFGEKFCSLQRTAGQFILYTGFAVFTTMIFWGTETLFRFVFSFENREILGGLIGLIIGYTTKYLLDRRWVFTQRY